MHLDCPRTRPRKGAVGKTPISWRLDTFESVDALVQHPPFVDKVTVAGETVSLDYAVGCWRGRCRCGKHPYPPPKGGDKAEAGGGGMLSRWWQGGTTQEVRAEPSLVTATTEAAAAAPAFQL